MALLQFGPIAASLWEITKLLLTIGASIGIAGWIWRMKFRQELKEAMKTEDFTGSMLAFFRGPDFKVIMIGVFDERYATKAELQALRQLVVDYRYGRHKETTRRPDESTGTD